MPQTYYTLTASYRLLGDELTLLKTLTAIARKAGYTGNHADSVSYDSRQKRRVASWGFSNSRQARAAEAQMKILRRSYPKMDIKTNVSAETSKDESLNEAAKRYSITAGQYKSLIKGGHARECDECHQCVPKYKGRYPKDCPGCGGSIGMPIEEQGKDTEELKKLKKRIKVGSVVGAGIGALKGARDGAISGSMLGGFTSGTAGGASRGAIKGALKHAALGGLKGAATGAGVGAGYHALRQKKVKESIIDATRNILSGCSVDKAVETLVSVDESGVKLPKNKLLSMSSIVSAVKAKRGLRPISAAAKAAVRASQLKK